MLKKYHHILKINKENDSSFSVKFNLKTKFYTIYIYYDKTGINTDLIKTVSKKVNPKTLKISTTGGSSGTPLKIGMQKNGIRELQKWQMYSWWGLTPGTNMASIYRGIPTGGIRKLNRGYFTVAVSQMFE